MGSFVLSPLFRQAFCRGLVVLLLGCAVLAGADESSARAKHKPVPQKEPDLKIVRVAVNPVPYSPADGPLVFTVIVDLPKDLDGAQLLEVSSLVSSPSKTSLRFLSTRQPVEPQQNSGSPDQNDPPPRISVTLRWDGTDHTKQIVSTGSYHYEIRAKLLTVSEKGPRTSMTSWPKRGTVEVK
ncbi:MAG TPA: hypothetical protein VNK46_02915 [Nitrospiraceae bacterium]|jgi:hypothetical protein|nr:hypothetical protein [Nitrospiraceae bacterium]